MVQLGKTDANMSDKISIDDVKLRGLNLICACLIHESNYYSSEDQNRGIILQSLEEISVLDAEFVLKLALYVRDDLNIRSTANFILAFASTNANCQPFLKKYFSSCVRLPSDLLDVVSLVLAWNDGKSGLPSQLRKLAAKKFAEFDVYQLAKYNKEKAQLKKNKKINEKKKEEEGKNQSSDSKGKSEEEEDHVAKKAKIDGKNKITLKQLIRMVHISEPVEAVMGILGKKYPLNEEEFQKSGLLGNFDASRSGKRMKLPVPETWETQLSAKGNKHTTWEELMDHNKLPFMAMLRNLRNFIVTGISPDHHEKILARLTDEKSVTNSRQLPWRFLSAYDAIKVDLEQMMNDILDHDGSEFKIIKIKVKGAKGKKMGATREIKKRVIIPVHMPDIPLIDRYRTSIDTSIRISTLHNIKPIEGRTLVLVDVSGSMDSPCSSRGTMGSLQSNKDVAILLGLMLQDACEDCQYRIFSSAKRGGDPDLEVELKPNTILENVKRVREQSTALGGGTDFPFAFLERLIQKKEKIDNFIILSDMIIAPDRGEKKIGDIINRYRKEVNPELLFIAVDLFGSGKSIVGINSEDDKNVLITGFSDNILRFIAERGSKGQLGYVDAIDQLKLQEKPKKANKNPSKKEGKVEESPVSMVQ
eukprot:TRINITY_DN3280_c0_g1_i1.p1 TRINITY_DN3280_c0_g1~~TRINITY_DN3280_c0_g1_i1.p1  ORF type:complete len:645 (+),score=292.71 TRINITY_DN3280_c0_g1_i1:178-2112(+)